MTGGYPALILAAGLGTRIQPLSYVRAKPAIPLGGEPIVRRIVGGLVRQECRDIVVNLHHLPHTITRVLGDGADLGASVRYSWEQPMVLGSAGGPRHALDIIGAPTFFIVNGDTLTDVDLAQLAACHEQFGAKVTLALVPNRHPQQYNGVALDADGCVIGFVPRGTAAEGSYHLVGVQIAAAEVFALLPDGTPAETIRGIYDAMLREAPGSIRGHVADASFWDIGTVRDYVTTSQAAPFRTDTLDRDGLDPSARVIESIVWDDVQVGAGATVERCILTDGVRVPAGARLSDRIAVRTANGMTTFPIES